MKNWTPLDNLRFSNQEPAGGETEAASYDEIYDEPAEPSESSVPSEASSPPDMSSYVTKEQHDQTQQQLNQWQNWMQNNPANPQQQTNPGDEAVRNMLSNMDYIPKQDVEAVIDSKLARASAEQAVKAAGFPSYDYANAQYVMLKENALHSSNKQKLAELQNIDTLYSQGRFDLAANALKQLSGQPAQQLPNGTQTFGHIPGNTQIAPSYAANSEAEFYGLEATDPAKYQAAFERWVKNPEERPFPKK